MAGLMDDLWTCLAKCFMEVNAPLRFPPSCSFIPLVPVKDLVLEPLEMILGS